MERLACVNIPWLALQTLLSRQPDWKGEPVAVVDQDTARGIVLQVNREATHFNIRPGMRYAEARSLCTSLRAGVIAGAELDDVIKTFHQMLFEFSPEISHGRWSPMIPHDPVRFAGVAWLRVTGLDALFGSYDAWATELYTILRDAKLAGHVAVGFSRFASYVLAKQKPFGTFVCPDVQTERDIVQKASLASLDIEPTTLENLNKLAIKTVGAFLELPPSGIQKRYGLEARALWEEATYGRNTQIEPIRYQAPIAAQVEFDHPQWESTRLLFVIKQQLHGLFLQLGVRSHDLKSLEVRFHQEDGEVIEHLYRPAMPSLDVIKVLDLIRLRLDRLVLVSPIVELHLVAHGQPYHRDQLNLLFDTAKRNREWTEHAIAQVRAEFGPVVKRAVVRRHHLPEHCFELRDFQQFPEFLQTPAQLQNGAPKDEAKTRHAVRRIYTTPKALSWFREHLPNHFTIRSGEERGIESQLGPYSVSGTWWESWDFRDYHFVKTKRGDIYWVFYDRRQKQWFLHGWVE